MRAPSEPAAALDRERPQQRRGLSACHGRVSRHATHTRHNGAEISADRFGWRFRPFHFSELGESVSPEVAEGALRAEA